MQVLLVCRFLLFIRSKCLHFPDFLVDFFRWEWIIRDGVRKLWSILNLCQCWLDELWVTRLVFIIFIGWTNVISQNFLLCPLLVHVYCLAFRLVIWITQICSFIWSLLLHQTLWKILRHRLITWIYCRVSIKLRSLAPNTIWCLGNTIWRLLWITSLETWLF